MSKYGDEKSIESRVEALEATIETQNKKLQILASLLSLSKISPFDSPLKQFFDRADMFLDAFYETNVPCHNDCSRRYRRAMDAADGDKEKEAQALDNVITCRADCGNILP